MLCRRVSVLVPLAVVVVLLLPDGCLGSLLPCPAPCYCFLKTVRCTHGSLTAIPIDDMPSSIEVFDLRFNRIANIRRHDLANLTSLITLFLSDNEITEIEDGAFSNLKDLSYLYLYSNKLTSLPSTAFDGLSSLKQLYLQNNLLSSIDDNAFDGLLSLQRLYLQRNKLTTLDQRMLLPLVSLKRLRLESNMLMCDCLVVKTVQFILKKRFLHVAAACHSPSVVSGILITQLANSDLDCRVPKLSQTPSDIQTKVGRSFKLSCQASGNPPAKIKWLKDNKELPGERGNHDSWYYKVDKATVQDSGVYTCIAQNTFGTTKSSARVIVTDQSKAFKTRKIEVVHNSDVVLPCQVGHPLSSVQWLKDGQLLSSSPRYNMLSSGHLEMSNIKYTDHGFFRCESRAGLASVMQTIQVVVKAPPQFKVAPANLVVLESETASFQCQAEGYPIPAIAWQRNGARLPADGRHIVLSSGTLRILTSRLADAGTYECLAINVIGVNVSTATLEVNRRVPPLITMHPAATTVQAGNTIHFACRAEGAPTPVIIWIKDGVQVTSGNRVKINASAATLEMSDIGVIDAGTWECAARNSAGFTAKTFELNVIGDDEQQFDGNRFVRPSFEKAKQEVNMAIAKTKQQLNNFKPNHPGDLLALFRFPSAEAIELARAAEIFEVALSIIQSQVDAGKLAVPSNGTRQRQQHFNSLVSPEYVNLLANLSGCTAHMDPVNCSDKCYHRSYRTYNGSCNNFDHPMQGASLTPFTRMLNPIYENGFNTPVGWNASHDTLPSARRVSMELVSSVNSSDDPLHTHMLMQWGQFLDHDLDFTAASPSSSTFEDSIPCHSTCDNKQPCFPIALPAGDKRRGKHKCMEFIRSSAVCGSGSTSVFFGTITPRQQINQITSYIDASNVYGSSTKDALNLRDSPGSKDDRGFLRIADGPFKRPMMPFNKDTPIDCQMNRSLSRIPCFLAGDHRANEHVGLLSMHTLWVREHNRIAAELGQLNQKWSGEKVYQEARKIVGAEMQHITYTEFLPKILGKTGMSRIGHYTSYKQSVDASIGNVFATAAYRFGHTLVQPILKRLNASMLPIAHGDLPLHKAFFAPHRLVEEGGIDPILRGLFGSPAKNRMTPDELVTSALTDHLFEMAHTIALDLAAINIQRGRDHGLPGYNGWRQFCNLTVANNFDDLKSDIPDLRIRNQLKQLYGSPDKVDVWVGGILEQSIPGSRLGPLFSCLIGVQFQRARDGDRLWYENPGTFMPDQLTQIRQASLSRVLCDNGDDITTIQPDAFRRVDGFDEMVPCHSLPHINLLYWKECSDRTSCGHPESAGNSVGQGLTRHARASRTDLGEKTSPHYTLDELNNRMNSIQDDLKRVSKQMKELLNLQDPSATLLSGADCVDSRLKIHSENRKWPGPDGSTCYCKAGVVLCA